MRWSLIVVLLTLPSFVAGCAGGPQLDIVADSPDASTIRIIEGRAVGQWTNSEVSGCSVTYDNLPEGEEFPFDELSYENGRCVLKRSR
jgi:hypothetical protein